MYLGVDILLKCVSSISSTEKRKVMKLLLSLVIAGSLCACSLETPSNTIEYIPVDEESSAIAEVSSDDGSIEFVE